MNGLALATRGYVSSAVSPLVASVHPETVSIPVAPTITVSSLPAPKTVSQPTPEVKPFIRPRRRK